MMPSRPVIRNIVKNASWAFSSQALSALIGIVTLALVARAVGPAGLGLFAVIQAYVRIIDRLLRLEGWQTVIRYGIEALEAEQGNRFRRLIGGSLALDLIGGVIAGFAAMLAAPWIAPLIGLGAPSGVEMLQIAALGMFLNFHSTATAIFRVHDRFDLLAKIEVGVALFRLALAAAVLLAGWGLWGLVAMFVMERFATGLGSIVIARRLLVREVASGPAWPELGVLRAENAGVARFVITSNANVMLRQTVQRLDVVILSALVDPAIVGLFHIARRIADAALRIGRPINQAIFPELTRSWVSGDSIGFRRLAFGCSALLAALSVVLVLPAAFATPWALETLFGADFVAATTMVLVQIMAAIFFLSGMVLNPALLSLGRDRELLAITAVASIAFLASFVPLVLAFGGIGAPLAHLLFNAFLTLGCLAIVAHATRRPALASGGAL